MAGIKKAASTVLMNGQSDVVVFDAVSNYDTATFASITASGQSLGQIVEDSTGWTGDDPETEEIKDEQGNIITQTVTAGTFGVEFDMANLSKDNIKEFLNGEDLTLTSTTFTDIENAVGFGVKLPVITRPLAILNDEANRAVFFPKAKMVTNITVDGKLYRLHVSATAEYIDLATLKTAMILNGKAVYATEG